MNFIYIRRYLINLREVSYIKKVKVKITIDRGWD